MKNAVEILKSSEKFHINLGLKRIKLILALLGNPQDKYKIIHVAGTNGKGSTCKIINEILIEHFKNTSIKTGLYTSPHLFSYCERIKINNIDIKDHIFNRLINDINNMAYKNNIDLTEFELLTAVAFYYFYIMKVDYVILEVGLGGKYDATNVIKNPLLEIITSIDFDHTERLGNTINKIALEKAGIIKENSKVIVNKNNLGFEVIKKVASLKNAELIEAQKINIKDNKPLINGEICEFNLSGAYQYENLALAICAIKNLNLKITNNEIKEALKKVSWKYRLEFNKEKNILTDGAHNPCGVSVLVNHLNEFYIDKKNIIFGCLKTKDYKKMLDLLFRVNNVLNFYFLEFNYPSSLKYDEIEDEYKNKLKKINSKDELIEILNNKTLSVVCGSLYLEGQLGIEGLL